MRALAEALAVKPPIKAHALDGFEDDGDDEHFLNACLEEIDRHRRIDEWIPSYHNVLSTTALDCKTLLARAGVIDSVPADFLQYTSEGTSECLRLNAFENLMSLQLVRSDAILRWFLFVLGNDPSPHVRDRMISIFGKTLGSVALGEHLEAAKEQEAQHDGLIIEQEASTEARQTDLARKQTVEGALNALKDELSSNSVLKDALWNAITTPALSIHQMGELLDICDLLYTPETSAVVVLRYPRYWKCSKIGKGKLLFTRSSRVRTTPIPKRRPPPPSIPLPLSNSKRENSHPHTAMLPPPAHQPLKLKLGGPKKLSLSGGPSTPAGNDSVPPSPAGSEGGKLKIKLKIGGPKGGGAGSPHPP